MQPFSGSDLPGSVISIPAIHLSPIIAWVLVSIGLAIFLFQTVIIAYHWYMYAPSTGLRRKVLAVHGIVSGLLIFLTVLGTFIITFTR